MNKLSQKCKTNQTEENLLMQSFKFFDINNNGQVDLNNFRKAIERIGVIVEDPDVYIYIYIYIIYIYIYILHRTLTDCLGSTIKINQGN